MVIFFALATLVAIWLLVFANEACTACAARVVGIVVDEVRVGLGPTLWVWKRNGVIWRFKLLPLGGSNEFRHHDEKGGDGQGLNPPPGSIQAASVPARLLVTAVGPVTSLLLGILFLGFGVFLGQPQLMAEPPDRPEQPPHLAHATDASTWRGQFQLAADTSGQYFARLVTFRPMDGWGGYVAFVAVAGRTGRESIVDWLTLVGLVGTTVGCVNLLPVPTMNGYQLLHIIAAAILGQSRLPDRVTFPLVYLGILVALVVFARMTWLDVCWIWGTMTY